MKKPIKGYKFGKFFLEDNLESRRLFNGDDSSVLLERDFKILRELIENENEFVSKEILQRFYPHDTENDVEKAIGRIRHSLFDNHRNPKYIKTADKGYVFIAEVEKIDEDSNPEPAAEIPKESVDYIEAGTKEPDPVEDDNAANAEVDGKLETAEVRRDALAVEKAETGEIKTESGNIFIEWRASDKFNQWLFNSDNKLAWGALVCFGVTLATSILILSIRQEYSLTIVSLTQAIIIFAAAMYPIHFLEGFGTKRDDDQFWNSLSEKEKTALGCVTFTDWKKSSESAENLLGKYKRRWKWILLSWAALYGCLFITGFPELRLDNSSANPDEITKKLFIALSIFNTFLNNCSSGTIYICFNILSPRTKRGKNNQSEIPDVLEKVILVIVVFTLIEVGYTYLYFIGVSQELPQIVQILKFFSGVSGIAAAAVYAQYFGRLHSKLLNPPSWLINLLFIYMAIQSLFLFLDIGFWGILLMDAALFFKSLLFLYMTFLFQSGRLFFYLMRIRKTYENVEEEFDTFSSILNK